MSSGITSIPEMISENPLPADAVGALKKHQLSFTGQRFENSAVTKVYQVKKGGKFYALKTARISAEQQFKEEVDNRLLIKNSKSKFVEENVAPHMPILEIVDEKGKYILVDWVEGEPIYTAIETLSPDEIKRVLSELVRYAQGWHGLGRTLYDITSDSKLDRFLVNAKKEATWMDLDANTMGSLEHKLILESIFTPEVKDQIAHYNQLEQLFTIFQNPEFHSFIDLFNSKHHKDTNVLLARYQKVQAALAGNLKIDLLPSSISRQDALKIGFDSEKSYKQLWSLIANLEEKELNIVNDTLQSYIDAGEVLPQIDAQLLARGTHSLHSELIQLQQTFKGYADGNGGVDSKPIENIRRILGAINLSPNVAMQKDAIKIREDYGHLIARILTLLKKSTLGKYSNFNDFIPDVEVEIKHIASDRNYPNKVAEAVIFAIEANITLPIRLWKANKGLDSNSIHQNRIKS